MDRARASSGSEYAGRRVQGSDSGQPAPTEAPSLSAPSGSSTGSYTVSWSSTFHASTYKLQEKKNSGSWTAAYSGSGKSKAFSGKVDATYSYRVQGCNSTGCGPWSATKAVLVSNVPATPGGLALSVTGPSYKPVVHVSWNAVSHATNYTLEETLPQQAPTSTSVGNTTSVSSLIFADGQVSYRVKACNSVGCSAWSGYKSVMLASGGGACFAEETETPFEETTDGQGGEP